MMLNPYGLKLENNKGKNIMCGCIYRHPNRDPDNLFEYTENALPKTTTNIKCLLWVIIIKAVTSCSTQKIDQQETDG